MLTQLKITAREKTNKKEERSKIIFILKRETCIYIFFLDCSTISNNSENDNIFIEGTIAPRTTLQPLATKITSTNTRNKLLSEGKIYFEGNLTFNMTLVYCTVLVRCSTFKLPSPLCPL